VSDLAVFQQQRPRLFALAYRLLGSAADAEDVVQSAYLRWAGAHDVREPAAFLTTMVSRLCLDELRSARARRERYVGPWLPEPVASGELGPLETAEQRSQVSYAALLLLERLTPQERAVCVLRDAFDYPYRDVAEVVGLTDAHCRQLHRRARARLAEGRARFEVPAERHAELTLRLFAAAAAGEVAALEQLLAEDVVVLSDGGGAVSAARRPVSGRSRVARFLVGIAARTGPVEVRTGEVNGAPALLVLDGGRLVGVAVAEPGPAGIRALYVTVAPDKLRRLSDQLEDPPAVTSGPAAPSEQGQRQTSLP